MKLTITGYGEAKSLASGYNYVLSIMGDLIPELLPEG